MTTSSKKNGRKLTDQDRKAKLEALRKQQRAAEVRSRALWAGAGTVVVIALVAVIALAVVNKKDTITPSALPAAIASISGYDGSETMQVATTTLTDDSGIDGVTAYQNSDGTKLASDHVKGTVVYTVNPPVGGQHNADWMTCGVYQTAVPTERAVHNLEHGAVWITYQPSLAAADVTTLTNLVKKQSIVKIQGQDTKSRYVDLSPYEGIDSPIVLSSWGHQLKVSTPDDPRIQQFIDKFRANQTYTPEYGAACNGEPDGGTPSVA